MKRTIMLISLIGLLMLLAGCMEPTDRPFFVKDKVKAEPTFLRPNFDMDRQLVLHYIIKNPTKLDFNGKVSYKFNDDCIDLNYDETSISVESDTDDSYSVTVRPYRYGNYDEDCYGTQTILLALSNNEGTNLYDSQIVEISITR